MSRIIQGKDLARGVYNEIKAGLGYLGFTPIMYDIVVGDDMVSLSYASLKKRIAAKIALGFELVHLPEGTSEEEVMRVIREVSERKETCGIIMQLPLPSIYDQSKVLAAIPSEFDIDCITPDETIRFYQGKSRFLPPTALAIVKIIDSLELDKERASIAILGKGKLVGKPTHYLLESSGYKVVSLDRSSQDRAEVLSAADVVVSGTGHPGSLHPDEVKQGVIIIDAGTSESEGSVVGDVNQDEFESKVSRIAPVPGGVGPLTVAYLLNNAYQVAQSLKRKARG